MSLIENYKVILCDNNLVRRGVEIKQEMQLFGITTIVLVLNDNVGKFCKERVGRNLMREMRRN